MSINFKGVLINNTEVVRALSRYYQSTSVLQIRFPVTYIFRDGVFRDTLEASSK